MKKYLFLLCLILLLGSSSYGNEPIFSYVEKLCNKDNGKLWGVNLYSPVIGIDSLRNIVSNMPDAPKTFPPKMPVANSTTELDGRRWTMVMWPLSGDMQEQSRLLIHEMFHYRQPELGLAPDFMPNNAHLSNRDARTLLKLEWNALKRASECNELQKLEALTDALIFRERRRELYPDYITEENALEILEGLAEYTGMRITLPSNEDFINDLTRFDYLYESDNMNRSFAYFSGPLYGLILDQSGSDWHKIVKADTDLGKLVKEYFGLSLSDNLERDCNIAKAKYGIEAIEIVEDEFEHRREARDEEIQRLFASENVSILECTNLSIQFSPNGMIQMEDGSFIIYDANAYWEGGKSEGRTIKVWADWRHIEIPKSDPSSSNGDNHTPNPNATENDR